MVKNNIMEVHARLIQRGFYSALGQVGARILGTTIIIEGDGTVLLDGAEWTGPTFEFGEGYTLETRGSYVFIGFPEPATGARRRLEQSTDPAEDGREDDFGINVFVGGGDRYGGCEGQDCGLDRRRLDDLSGFGNMHLSIKAYGTLFEGSNGLCGDWDSDGDGFSDRDGDPIALDSLYPTYPLYDGTDYGNIWQVASNSDMQILSSTETPPDDQWGATECVPMDSFTRQRHLQAVLETDCPRCNEIGSIVGTLNCLYDATVLSCDDPIVTGIVYDDGVIYGASVDADADLLCLDIEEFLESESSSKTGKSKTGITGKTGKTGKSRRKLGDKGRELRSAKSTSTAKASKSPKSSKSTSTDPRVSECEAQGGECVVYCDVMQPDEFECVAGLCDVDIDFGEPLPVLTFGRYYTACSCKIPVPP